MSAGDIIFQAGGVIPDHAKKDTSHNHWITINKVYKDYERFKVTWQEGEENSTSILSYGEMMQGLNKAFKEHLTKIKAAQKKTREGNIATAREAIKKAKVQELLAKRMMAAASKKL